MLQPDYPLTSSMNTQIAIERSGEGVQMRNRRSVAHAMLPGSLFHLGRIHRSVYGPHLRISIIIARLARGGPPPTSAPECGPAI
jgi:hypothetical protein